MRDFLSYIVAGVLFSAFVYLIVRERTCTARDGVLVVGIVRVHCVQPNAGTLPTHAPVDARALSANPFAGGRP
jgi:hypothetical protein